jgi:DNA-binding NarL/FixJ family response regulator
LSQLHRDLETVNGKERLRILHVDDDQSVLQISKQMMMEIGNFEVDSSLSVDEAFQKLSTGHYDVVVSDYEMPQKDGLQFLKELRLQKNEIAFVLFTGKGSEEVALRALNLGAEGYYRKEGSVETVYEELSYGIQLIVKRKSMQTSLRVSKHLIKKVHNSAPSLIHRHDLIEHENIYEFNQGSDQIVETTASLEEYGHSASMPTIKCACGAQILVIPDLRTMIRAIERHAAEHRRMGINDEKDSDANVKVKELLTKQLLKATSELNK